MKKVYSIVFLLLFVNAFSQKKDTIPAGFKGGDEVFSEYLNKESSVPPLCTGNVGYTGYFYLTIDTLSRTSLPVFIDDKTDREFDQSWRQQVASDIYRSGHYTLENGKDCYTCSKWNPKTFEKNKFNDTLYYKIRLENGSAIVKQVVKEDAVAPPLREEAATDN